MPPDNAGGGEPRRYSDKEVSRLLKYATDLQEEDEAGRRALGGGGMTLATLQEVAAEAGIEPRYVQLAAARIDSPEPTGIGPALAGSPLLIRAERVVPGELLDEDYERIAEEIASDADMQGNATMVGRRLTWSSNTEKHPYRSLQVTVVSRNGETRVRAEETLHRYASELFAGVVGGGGVGVGMGVGFGVGLGVLGSGLFAGLFPVTVIGGLYVAMRRVMKSKGRKRRAAVERLVDRIARHVRPGP